MSADLPQLPNRQWFQCDESGAPDWRDALRPGGVMAVLNFAGDAEFSWAGGAGGLKLRPSSLGWLRVDGSAPLASARRPAGRRHEALLVHFPDEWLQRIVSRVETPLLPDLRSLTRPPAATVAWAVHPLQPEDRAWARGFVAPHLCDAARQLLDEARLTEFFLRKAFGPARDSVPGLTRTQRLAQERIERVKNALRNRLDDPPPLEELARTVGCHAHYLSRTFTQVEGISLTLWLRRARIDRAAALIASGRCNVSEAAVEVGYHSLSHFSRAFFEEKGVSPSKWAGKKG